MSEMEELYQEIILDHNKRPRNYRALDPHTHHAEGHNPMCGDEIEIFLNLADGKIAEVTFQGQGCAISRASASLMTELLEGKSEGEAHAAFENVMELLRTEGREADLMVDGEIAALAGVRKFPARIKCATLAWHALEAALKGGESVSTEAE